MGKKITISCARWLALILLFTVSAVFSGTTGKIAGRVVDVETGEPLIGANIVIQGTNMGAAADAEGEFFIINVPPGTYSVVARMIGYTPKRMENVRVSVDLTSKVNFQLSGTVLEAGEEVVVTAQREIQKDLTSSEVSISSESIEDLPVRSISEMLSLQAGITRDASGSLHIRGGRTNEITYMVDGVQVVNPLNRSAGISIDDQAIEELKAITGTFNAEYGQALSGVVNIVTKKASDEFTFNLTGYLGDYLSFDNDLYYVNTNEEWVHAAARALNRKNDRLDYDLFQYLDDDRGFDPAIFAEKPWLEKEGYLNTFNPLKSPDIQLNMSGPIPFTNNRVSFFVSGRYNYSPGYQYGIRYFMPWGFQSPVSDTTHTFKQADNKLTVMGWYRGLSTQSKLNFKMTDDLNLSYGLYFNNDHSYSADATNDKYVPDAGRHYYTDRYTHILSATYVFSKSTFLDLKGSYYFNHHENYAYKDPFDYRYMPTQPGDFEQYVFAPGPEDNISISSKPNDFAYWGNDAGRAETTTKYTSLKLDLTSQVTKRHLVKLGVSSRLHEIDNDYYTLQFSQADYRPVIPETSSPFHTYYTATPQEFAAYIQDKIEFQELVINLGVRYDYFYSDGRLLTDPMDPQVYSPFKYDHIYQNYTPTTPDSELVEYTSEERKAFWYKDPEPKYQISPRFGLSFPISEAGVIHFSYGHFFQNPEFQYLYANPNFWITGAGAENLVGNADLKAERTVMYEIGLQQKVSSNWYLHVTGFYRDIRDWVGTGFPQNTYRGLTYYSYVNKDHARAKGVTLSSQVELSPFYINLDYTYMMARGTSSNPRDAYNDLQSDRAPRIQLINLNWDQRHALSVVSNYSRNGWSATLTSSMNSGLPYTPSFVRGEATGSSAYIGLRENSERKPFTYNFDLRLSKIFKLEPYNIQLYLDITNLLDTRNVLYVYSDTGKADYTLESYQQESRLVEISDIQEFYTRPGMYAQPRYISLGLRLSY